MAVRRPELLVAAVLAVVATVAAAQKKEAPVPTLEVSGILADAKGPLAKKVVRVGPVDSKGQMLMIRSLNEGHRVNPEGQTDAAGRFTVTVSRNLFRGYTTDAIGLAAYTDLGGGRMSTSHQPAILKVDATKDRVDVGRVVLQPFKPR